MEGEHTGPVTQYLAFTLAGESFAVEILKAREVLKFTAMTKVPNTPEYMRGVINLRGIVLPVVDIRLRLGLGRTEPTMDTCVAIFEVALEEGATIVGALVDAVEEVIEIDETHMSPPPKLGRWVDTGAIRGMGRRDERFVMILDLDKVFGTIEVAPSVAEPPPVEAQA